MYESQVWQEARASREQIREQTVNGPDEIHPQKTMLIVPTADGCTNGCTCDRCLVQLADGLRATLTDLKLIRLVKLLWRD